MENNYKKVKWLSEEALQTAVKRKAKSKGEKERYTYLNAEFQRIARRDKKAFLSDQGKEIEENNKQERLEISSRKFEISSIQFSSITQSCPTPCDPMNHSTPGLPIHYQLDGHEFG